MKKLRLILITIFIFLICGIPVYAENTDVSGRWTIAAGSYPEITVHTKKETVKYPLAENETIIENYDETVSLSNLEGVFNVKQDADGNISASRTTSSGLNNSTTVTLSGKVIGNRITVIEDARETFPSVESVPTKAGVIITFANMPITEKEGVKYINYSYTGGYFSSTQLSIPTGRITWTRTANFNNTTGSIVVKNIGQPPDPPAEIQKGKSYSDPQRDVGEPINSVTGNMYILATDLTIPGKGMDFSFVRAYNSQAASSNETGPLGYGWTHSYNIYLTQDTQNSLVKIRDGEGKGYLFADNQDGTFVSQRGEYATLSRNASNFIWRKKDGKQYIFELNGKLTQIKDRNNNKIDFAYNSQNQLIAISDTAGRQISLAYSQGRISSLVGPSATTFTYDYDAQGNLISMTDPLGRIATYAYDTQHNMAKKTDGNNQSIYYAYNSSNRCTSSKGENNSGRVDLVFDPANKQTSITDSKGNTTVHYYNDDSLITKIKDAQGKETLSSWDTNFNLMSRTDELGRITKMEYDGKGNLTKITDPDNNVTSFTYDPSFNLLLASTDAQGNLTTYTRDSCGNPTKVTDAYNNSTNYTYNSAGQVSSAQNALGNFTNFTYDEYGNLTQAKNALNNITTFNYDDGGNLIQSKDGQGNITEFTYDKLNQLTKVAYSDNSSVSYAYDATGNRISITDGYNYTTSYVFDQFHRITSTTDNLGHAIESAYDAEGNLILLADQNDNKTIYEYDSLNRLISQTDALGNRKQYRYDAGGNRAAYIDANGQTTSYEYDKLNRLTRITYPDAVVSYTYDSLNRRLSMTDAQGITNYAYDKLGRLIQVDGPGSNDTISYTYDKLGNRLTLIAPDNKITTYGYDALNRLTSITDPQQKVTSLVYDSLGNLTSMIYPNGIKTTYVYDTLNRLLKLTGEQSASPNTKIAEFSYTYDKLGRRTQANMPDGSQINYTYDAQGQLTSEDTTSSANPHRIAYEYDPAGNRTQMINQGSKFTYSYNSANQLVEEGFEKSNSTTITVTGRASDANGITQITVNGLYAVIEGNNFSCSGVTLQPGANIITVIATDKAGNSTTKVVNVAFDSTTKTIYTYDNNGNLIKKEGLNDTLSLSYDSASRLTSFNNSSLNQTYQYDGEGKRISKKTGSSTITYLYDGLNVIREDSASGSTNYTRNPNAPGGIGGIVNQLSPANIPTYYHYDGLGSVTDLTDSTAKNTQTYSYDAFGNSQGDIPNAHGFLAKETDATGLLYFGARYYYPKIGRFITQDPSGMTDGPNLYLYCKNNPVNSIDFYGLDTFSVNYELLTSSHRPSKGLVSHSYSAITNKKGIVVETFSWGNNSQGKWFHNDPQDLEVAQEAINSGGATWEGNELLDYYLRIEFDKVKNTESTYLLLINDCKTNGVELLSKAKKAKEENKRRLGK